MSETPSLPSPGQPEDATFATPKNAFSSYRDIVPWLGVLGFLVLAGAILYLWLDPGVPPEVAQESQQLQTIQRHLEDDEARMARLEQRSGQVSVADMENLSTKLATLETKVSNETQISSRLDVLSGRIESLAGRTQTGQDALKQTLDGLSNRVASMEKLTSDEQAVVQRLNRITRLQKAAFALTAGLPVGDISNAPPALARFATAPPPTEATLRLAFRQAEQMALVAKQPDDANAPFVDRVWDRAQTLVTVRKGDALLVGDSSAAILAQARAALDVGDLPAAVATLETLKGQPKEAMSGWLAQAQSLIAARSALADLAGQA